MAVKRYKGKYVTAEAATKYIDVESINEGCDVMDAAADRLSALTNKVSEFKTVCSKEALCVNDSNMEEPAENYQSSVSKVADDIKDLVVSICKATLTAHDKLQTELNEEAKKRDESIKQEKAAEKKAKEEAKKAREADKKAREKAKKDAAAAKKKKNSTKKKKYKNEIVEIGVISNISEGLNNVFSTATIENLNTAVTGTFADAVDVFEENSAQLLAQEKALEEMEKTVAKGGNK